MKHALNDPEIRARYLEALRQTGVHSQASVAVGLEPAWTCRYRKRVPEFAAECGRVMAEAGAFAPRPFVRWTPRLQQRFLEAYAASGNASAAALGCGMTLDKVFQRRRHDAGFNADWADARNLAAQRLMDKVFEGAMHGFVRTETVDGRTKRIVYQRPDLMHKLADKLVSATGRHRMLEITPELVERAHAQEARRIEFAVEQRLAEMAEAANAAAAAEPAGDQPLQALPALPTFGASQGTRDPDIE